MERTAALQDAGALFRPLVLRSGFGLWTLDFGLTQNSAQVCVARLVLDIEANPLPVPGDFGADDGLDAGGSGGLGELNGAMEIVMVG